MDQVSSCSNHQQSDDPSILILMNSCTAAAPQPQPDCNNCALLGGAVFRPFSVPFSVLDIPTWQTAFCQTWQREPQAAPQGAPFASDWHSPPVHNDQDRPGARPRSPARAIALAPMEQQDGE